MGCKLHNCGTWPGPPGFHPEELSYSIKDRVKVPSHLEPGNYTVSWRWDCEESQQVWTNCADVEITVAPSSCPGRSLSECIGLCPDSPPAHQICADVCLQ